MKVLISILLVVCALAFFVAANDEHNFNGPVSVGNGTTAQEFFFTNNSYHYAPIQMSLVIHSVSNVVSNTSGFLIQQNFQIVDTIRGISVILFSEAIEGAEDTFTPITIDQMFSPCLAEFLISPSTDIQFITSFDSNVTAELDISFTLIIFNASIEDAQPVTVPTMSTQYFTFTSPTFGLTSAFDLKFALINTTSDTNISDSFSQLTIGCSGVSGSTVRTYNLSETNSMQFAESIAGVKGPIAISLTAAGTDLPAPNWLFVINEAPDSSSDDGLEGWQIALIVVGCVAGAVLLATVVGVAVWFIRSRSGYSTL